MRWNRETSEERATRLSNWHRWFAWHPVRIWKLGPGVTHRTQTKVQVLEHSNKIVWLEHVMRKCDDDTKLYANTEKEVTMIRLADPIVKRKVIIHEQD